jgi:hypothetical protein
VPDDAILSANVRTSAVDATYAILRVGAVSDELRCARGNGPRRPGPPSVARRAWAQSVAETGGVTSWDRTKP